MKNVSRSKEQIVLDYLSTGRSLTPAQAAGSMQIGDPYATVRRLRESGNAVYTNKTSQGNISWRLGRPSKRMVAAAFSAYGTDIFAS